MRRVPTQTAPAPVVPVAPPDSLAELTPLADEVVALHTPDHFYAVGAHYGDFTQTTDEEVIDALLLKGGPHSASAGP
jgi:predicted phosphoribosyltransferase